MRFKLFLMVALMTVIAAVSAAEPTILGQFQTTKYGKSHDVTVYKLEEVTSNVATMDEFAVELGYKLNDYTAANGFENCANICRSANGQWAATVITIQSHAVCPTAAVCPGDAEPVGVDIHSHVRVTRYLPNDVDRLFLNGSYGPREKVSTEPSAFGPGDYEKPGYMVNSGRLRFQNGEGRERTVWDMRKPNPSAATASL